MVDKRASTTVVDSRLLAIISSTYKNMDYKFDDVGNEDTSIEFSAQGYNLSITSYDYNEGVENNWVNTQIRKEDIDELIIALTNIKNEISDWEKKANS